MSGKLEILWNGKRITIERSTKGRIPLGEFKAYETESGLPVLELTASNCGQQLLGVEKSVFLRSGFLRLTDLPVTQDEALRKRLNALVTTADESGSGELLARKLKDLKNRCRFNRTGLLPQAEAQQAELETKLERLHTLQEQALKLKQRQAELESQLQTLENHAQALQYAQSLSHKQKLTAAKASLAQLSAALSTQEAVCAALPSRQETEQKLSQLRKLKDLADATGMESQMLPPPPSFPECDPLFDGLLPEEAILQAKQDLDALEKCRAAHKKAPALPWIVAFALLAAALALLIASIPTAGFSLLGTAVILLILSFVMQNKVQRHNRSAAAAEQALLAKHRPFPPDQWLSAAQDWAAVLTDYLEAKKVYQKSHGDLTNRMLELKRQLQQLTEGTAPSAFLQKWNCILDERNKLDDLRRDLLRAQEHAAALEDAFCPAEPPPFPDRLTCSGEETAARISETKQQHHQLQLHLGQVLGQMDALGEETALLDALTQVRSRIERLEETYAALILAQETLAAASMQLQRRFAPRITRRTRELFSRLTGGRYTRVALDENMALQVGKQEEDILRSDLWPSDGTVDQLYLALRLAVAEALTPEAPLILDDALVRFDDQRLVEALAVLQEESAAKQILLFTCQSRENNLLPKKNAPQYP